MSRRALAFVALATLFATDARSQWMTQDPDESGDSSGNRTFTTPGGAGVVAAKLLTAMRLERKQRDLCEELGCIVIVNASTAFRLEGFYVGEEKRGRPAWGSNQFGKPLLPMRATYRFKMPGRTCLRPARFVFRHLRSKEAVEVEDRVDFCPTPRAHTLLRLNVLRPSVTAE